MLPAEQAAPLKLLEKGVSKEALAGLVLLEFPCELASAVLAGRWASSPTPFTPFMLGYKIRLVMAAAVTLVVSHHCVSSMRVGLAGWLFSVSCLIVSLFLSLCLSVRLSIRPSVCLSVCVYVCLSVCLSSWLWLSCVISHARAALLSAAAVILLMCHAVCVW